MYTTRRADEVGWYEPDPFVSRRLVADALKHGAESVIDVGGGASFLVDRILEFEVKRVAVLDISEAGMAVSKRRLGDRADRVEWILADVTARQDIGRFDVWHDRAVFHFLTDDRARMAYIDLAERTVPPGGTAILATFAPDGPERCSGRPVQRYDAEQLAAACGPAWQLVRSERYIHTTPGGVAQSFVYSTLRRVTGGRP